MKRLPVIRDYMDTYVHTLTADTPILEAVQFLLDHHVTGAPIVEGENELVGMLTSKDCLRLLAKGHGANPAEGTVADFMTRNPMVGSPGMDIYYAAGIFINNPFRRLPIVENGIFLVGAITRYDLMRAVREHYEDLA